MAKPLVLLGTAGALVLCGFLGFWLYADHQTSPRSWPSQEFSSSKWKALPPEERYVFYRDLEESGQLDGAPREEVVHLLGTPTYEEPSGRYVTYVIKYAEPGEPSFNSIYLLHIDFDASGQTVKAYRVRAD